MSNKKFNLREKLMSFSTNNEDEVTRDFYPPVIAEIKAENELAVSLAPPKFNKEKFENLILNEEVKEVVEAPTAVIDDSEKNEKGIIERSLLETNGQILDLKKSRKRELDTLVSSRVDIGDLTNKNKELASNLLLEKEKNKEVSSKLNGIKADITKISSEIEKQKNDKIKLEIEYTSVLSEVERMSKSRDDLEQTLRGISEDSSKTVQLLANSHQRRNELKTLMNANRELIEDFKKKIIVNKETINSIRDDIDFKNKQISDQSCEAELLGEEVSFLVKKKENLTQEKSKLEIELSNEEVLYKDIESKAEQIKNKIGEIEVESNRISSKRKNLSTQFHELSSKFNTLEKLKEDLEEEINTKNDIISNLDSQIHMFQEKCTHLETKNVNLKQTATSREREVEKLQKVFEIKKSKISRVESSNYELERRNEVLTGEIEELSVQKVALERRLGSLDYDLKKYESEFNIFTTQLSDLKSENKDIDQRIIVSAQRRDETLEKNTSLKVQMHKDQVSIEQKQDDLSKIETDYLRQSNSLSILKERREALQKSVSSIDNALAEKTYELKQVISSKRTVSSEVFTLNERERELKLKTALRTKNLEEAKAEKMQLLTKKLNLEEKVNNSTIELSELDSKVFSEKEIVKNISEEYIRTQDHIDELRGYTNALEEDLVALRDKKSQLEVSTNDLYIKKRSIESDSLNIDRRKSEVQSDLIRNTEQHNLLEKEYTILDSKFRSANKAVNDLEGQRSTLREQIATRQTLIQKKKMELHKLERAEKDICNEIEQFSSTFKNSNNELITTTMDVKSIKEEIKRKQAELQDAKGSYTKLTGTSRGLKEDHDQQMLMIKELSATKNKYLSLIEELSVKNSQKFASINENNSIIETMKEEVENLKENVHILKNYRKKKVA